MLLHLPSQPFNPDENIPRFIKQTTPLEQKSEDILTDDTYRILLNKRDIESFEKNPGQQAFSDGTANKIYLNQKAKVTTKVASEKSIENDEMYDIQNRLSPIDPQWLDLYSVSNLENDENKVEIAKREASGKGLLDEVANGASQLMPPWLAQVVQNAEANMVLGTYQAMVVPMRSVANMTGPLLRPIIQGIQGLVPSG